MVTFISSGSYSYINQTRMLRDVLMISERNRPMSSRTVMVTYPKLVLTSSVTVCFNQLIIIIYWLSRSAKTEENIVIVVFNVGTQCSFTQCIVMWKISRWWIIGLWHFTVIFEHSVMPQTTIRRTCNLTDRSNSLTYMWL